MVILGIETSCDDTGVAVVKDGREVLVNLLSSQVDIHSKFGGVVPEVASRNHLLVINNLIEKALKQYTKKIDAVAVTYGGGLIGSLMVGLNAAKAFSYSFNIPLIAVNHIHGHIAACYLNSELKPPFNALVVSGGHTEIIKVQDYTKFKSLISTTDDSAGECFDKVARVLGLPYPGGPEIEKLAKQFSQINNIQGKGEDISKRIIFNYKENEKEAFSYSGLKSAVINYLNTKRQKGEEINIPEVCAAFQEIALSKLIKKSVEMTKRTRHKTLVLAGGVSANKYLREKLIEECEKNKIKLYVPEFNYCTDNAAMIASQGYYNYINSKGISDLNLKADSSL